MATVKYPLANNDLYVPDIPNEILEFYILTKNNIDCNRLKALEEEDKLVDLKILFNQYHLVQYCDSIDTVFPMDVFRCDFHYENIDGQRVVGNYYVPHFYIKPFMYGKEQSFSDKSVSDLCFFLGQLPAKKKNLHIGFVKNDNIEDNTFMSTFTTIKKSLKKYGYIPDFTKEDESDLLITDFGVFSWDDSVFDTITVIIDINSNQKQVVHNIRRFLTMDADYSDNHFYCGGRLVYISYCFDNNYYAGINPGLLSPLQEWLKIDELPYHLFPMWIYYPVSSNVVVDNRDWEIRRLIWNFKGDISNVTSLEHKKALSTVKEKVISTIGNTLGFNLKKEIIFCCVPSSTKQSFALRYKEFSERVCFRLNMVNGYDMVNYIEDSTPKHLGGEGEPKYDIINEGIKGKPVIVFDDIYTTGNTLRLFCAKLVKRGACVIGAIVLGMTETDKCFEEYLGYKGYFDMYSDKLW